MTINKTFIENLVEKQNTLINHIQDDIDAAIEDSNQTLYALESLQEKSTRLERAIYKTIFYAYYQALYHAMKTHNIPQENFAMITEEEILIYLPEPSALQ